MQRSTAQSTRLWGNQSRCLSSNGVKTKRFVHNQLDINFFTFCHPLPFKSNEHKKFVRLHCEWLECAFVRSVQIDRMLCIQARGMEQHTVKNRQTNLTKASGRDEEATSTHAHTHVLSVNNKHSNKLAHKFKCAALKARTCNTKFHGFGQC